MPHRSQLCCKNRKLQWRKSCAVLGRSEKGRHSERKPQGLELYKQKSWIQHGILSHVWAPYKLVKSGGQYCAWPLQLQLILNVMLFTLDRSHREKGFAMRERGRRHISSYLCNFATFLKIFPNKSSFYRPNQGCRILSGARCYEWRPHPRSGEGRVGGSYSQHGMWKGKMQAR